VTDDCGDSVTTKIRNTGGTWSLSGTREMDVQDGAVICDGPDQPARDDIIDGNEKWNFTQTLPCHCVSFDAGGSTYWKHISGTWVAPPCGNPRECYEAQFGPVECDGSGCPGDSDMWLVAFRCRYYIWGC